MPVKYLDPYKEDVYGKLRGNKDDCYFKAVFETAKIYKADDSYIIAGKVSKYDGVTRSYKPELPLELGLCALPIYGQEYEIRRKDGETWVSDKITPSIFEKLIYNHIKSHEDSWLDKNLGGSFTHLPDGMIGVSLDEVRKNELLDSNFDFTELPYPASLPAYEIPKTYGGARGGGKSYGLKPEDKLEFLRKQLAKGVKNPAPGSDEDLLLLIEQFIVENPVEKPSTQLYFDCLLGCVK